MEGGFSIENVIQGVFAADAAVLTNQTFKQSSKREPGKTYMNHFGYNIPQEGVEIMNEGENDYHARYIKRPLQANMRTAFYYIHLLKNVTLNFRRLFFGLFFVFFFFLNRGLTIYGAAFIQLA